MSVSDMSKWMAKFPQDWVESRYGLEAHEWAGSLSDRVMAIINKNDPAREYRVNALLYDNARLLEKRFQGYRRPEPDEDFIEYAEFRDAISHVMENGISISDEAYSQIHYVDSTCVRSLTKALLRPYHEVYPNANVQVYYRRELREGKPPKPSDGYIKSVYGLRGDEWTGTSADVRTIINQRSSRIGSMGEQRVNDFLRDQVAVFETGMEKLEAKNATYDDMKADACAYGYDLRDAIEEAVGNGILIKAETMNAIKRVEHNYVTPYGGESLTRQYDKLYELNDARKHHHETESSLASSHEKKSEIGEPRFMLDELGNLQSEGHGIEGFESMLSIVRGQAQRFTFTDGESLAPSTPSQVSRQGSIAAALPGSSITVGRKTPRVSPTARRMGIPEPQMQTSSVDDDFEL